MSNQNDQREPSMEEILASIRQIISEDGDEVPGGAAGAHPGPEPVHAPDPLDLTQVVNEDGSVTDLNAPRPAPEIDPEQAFGEPAVSPSLEGPPLAPEPEAEPVVHPGLPVEELVSPERATAVQSALGRLSSQTRVRGQADPTTLEGLVAELLRPMLKEWLDENLPRMVERAVREEIDRISKRAG